MLQDLNYQDENYQDENMMAPVAELKKIRCQIKYLENSKADCLNIRGCNSSSYINFCIDNDGNEVISGVHCLSTPICGFSTLEEPVKCLLAQGGGNLATMVMQHESTSDARLALVSGVDAGYTCICYSPYITAGNCSITVPNLRTNDICNTGSIRSNCCVSTSCIVANDANVTSLYASTGSFVDYVKTGCYRSDSALSMCAANDIVFTYGCHSSHLCKDNGFFYGKVCSTCVNAGSITADSISITNATGLSLVNCCTNGTVWLTDTAVRVGTSSRDCAPWEGSVSIGTDAYAIECNVAVGRCACSLSDNGIAIGCGACTFSCCGWYILKHIRHGYCGVSGEITMELKYPGGYPFRCDFYNALFAATKPGYDNILWFTGSELIIGGTDRNWIWSGPTEGYINSSNELMVHHLYDDDWHGFSSTCTSEYPFQPHRPKILTLTYSLKSCNPI